MKSNIIVSGSEDFIKFYSQLPRTAPLKAQLDDAMDLLKKNPDTGNRIKTRMWPAKYVKKYNINNLYRYSLGSGWRMIYTIIGQQGRINCVMLEVLDHRNYDKLFGYKTS